MERARVGVPPGERAPPTLSASGLPLSDAAHSARAISQGCGKGVAWRGCGSGGAERTVVPRDRVRLGGAPEALSARQPRVRHPPWAPRALPGRVWGGVGRGGWCGVWWKGRVVGLGVRIPTSDLRRIGGPRASITTHQATITAGAGSAKLRMLPWGLGRSPSIEAPQGIFFCGTVTFDQKILRKFLPQYPEPPGPGPKHLARTSPGAWTSPPNPGLDRWWSVWTRVVRAWTTPKS